MIRSIMLKIYFFFVVPVKAIQKYLMLIGSVCLLFLTFFYGIGVEHILNHGLLRAEISDILKIQNWKPRDNTTIYDSSGELISEQFNEYHVYIPFDKIPKSIINAVVAIEDRKFWEHQGIDIYSIFRAAKTHIAPKKHNLKQGASTLTQQLVKNLLLTNEKTVTRKVREIILSLYLEKVISKEKIIEIYCNTMFLGQGSYGVGAAAKRFFNKDVQELDIHESALIAGLFQSPGKYNPNKYPDRAKKRQLKVLNAMSEVGYIETKKLRYWKEKEISYKKYESTYGEIAPFFVDYVIEKSQELLKDKNIDIKDSGLKIYTTLDSKIDEITKRANEESVKVFSNMEKSIVWDNLKEDSVANKVEVASLVLNRKNGNVLAMNGGRDYAKTQFNRSVNALRAPGSVFKTITYALGLKKGLMWNKQYYVSPITIGNYRPRTQFSKLFTESTMLKAFYQSINSPAVLIGEEVGMKNVFEFAKKLGIQTALKEEAATLLGGSEVTLMDMARVYQTFANSGESIEPIAIKKIETRDGKLLYQAETVTARSKQNLDKKTNELIVEGLKSVVRYGTAYKARHLSGKIAGKTGTSNKSKDNWFCGFTDDLVVIVWMGNDDQNSFHSNISASNTAVPVWTKIAEKTIKYLKTDKLKRPRFLEYAKINPNYGQLDPNGVGSYFIRGTAPEKTKSDLYALELGKQLRVGMNEF